MVFDQRSERPSLLDPNTIPPSPTFSALQRLSIAESPPSASSTGSRTPIAQLTPLPNDLEEHTATPKAVPMKLEKVTVGSRSPRSAKGKTQSKLSSLASSRSSVSSRGSESFTDDLGSKVTYPLLRPSAESRLSLAETEALSDLTATGASSMSSHVRRALQTALQMEAMDALSSTPPATNRPSAPIQEASPTILPVSSPPSEIRSRPPSKLSQLAQTRAPKPVTDNNLVDVVLPSSAFAQTENRPTSTSSKLSRRAKSTSGLTSPGQAARRSSPPEAETPAAAAGPSRRLSKLSQLAQSKAQQGATGVQQLDAAVVGDAASQTSDKSNTKSASRLAHLTHAKVQQAMTTQSHGDIPAAITASPQTSAGSKSTSKLAQLAHTRAQQTAVHTPPDNDIPKTRDPATSQVPSLKSSKLAQLAQAKAQQNPQSLWMSPKKTRPPSLPGLMVHQSHTEYVTPIANGPTATTAITTTYQSLSDLGHPQRSEPATRSMHIFARKNGQSSGEAKQSKLAMKSKRSHKQSEPEPEPTAVYVDPIFAPVSPPSRTSSSARASPSAFASVLIDSDLPPAEIASSKGRESKGGVQTRQHRHKSARSHETQLPPASSAPAQTFAFDVPSPDDIVFNARRGTSLAQRSSARPSSATPSRVSVASGSALRA